MNIQDSALYHSGQAWKFRFMTIGIMIGGIVMFLAKWLIESLSAGWFTLIMMSGVAVVFGSLFYPAASIRCPSCKARWLWLALSTSSHNTWMNRVLQPSCPVCGFPQQAPRQTPE